jgi:hypothetical protein
MSNADRWKEFACDDEAPVRVWRVVAETHEELGQRLLADPLSVLLENGLVDSDEGWRAQVQVVNADIPTGPLPLPGEIHVDETRHFPWVIRKHVIIITICDDLQLVIVVVCRFETDRATAVDVLEKSLEQRQSENWGPR